MSMATYGTGFGVWLVNIVVVTDYLGKPTRGGSCSEAVG